MKPSLPPLTSLTSLDVARRAGVSRTAVSYVLNENGKRNVHVSEETRAKVLQAAQELGYSTHNSARALRKGQSEELCIIVDLPLTIHRTELFTSIQQHAFRYGYPSVVYFIQGFSQEQLKDLLLKVFARRPMGIFATAQSMTPEHVAQAERMGVDNIVLYSVKPLEYARTIILPTKPVGYLAAQHLLEHGHRHLALVQPIDPFHKHGFQERLEGMQAALATFEETTLDVLPLELSLSHARSLVDTALTSVDRPTGIYAYNDEYALLLLGALADRGIQVPQEVAVIGTDDISFGEIMRPTLTTICFDTLSLAHRAVEMLIARYKGQPLSEELTRPLIPQLVPRQSTGCLQSQEEM